MLIATWGHQLQRNVSDNVERSKRTMVESGALTILFIQQARKGNVGKAPAHFTWVDEIESSHPQLCAWQAALFIIVSSDLAC
jgi:hypothetical protein